MGTPAFNRINVLNKPFKNGLCPLLASWMVLAGIAAGEVPARSSAEAIPWPELGARAGAQYEGAGLSIARTEDGALLRCVFQKLEGQVTEEGLWLQSTVAGSKGERFRIVARAVGRVNQFSVVGDEVTRLTSISSSVSRFPDFKSEPVNERGSERGALLRATRGREIRRAMLCAPVRWPHGGEYRLRRPPAQ